MKVRELYKSIWKETSRNSECCHSRWFERGIPGQDSWSFLLACRAAQPSSAAEPSPVVSHGPSSLFWLLILWKLEALIASTFQFRWLWLEADSNRLFLFFLYFICPIFTFMQPWLLMTVQCVRPNCWPTVNEIHLVWQVFLFGRQLGKTVRRGTLLLWV